MIFGSIFVAKAFVQYLIPVNISTDSRCGKCGRLPVTVWHVDCWRTLAISRSPVPVGGQGYNLRRGFSHYIMQTTNATVRRLRQYTVRILLLLLYSYWITGCMHVRREDNNEEAAMVAKKAVPDTVSGWLHGATAHKLVFMLRIYELWNILEIEALCISCFRVRFSRLYHVIASNSIIISACHFF